MLTREQQDWVCDKIGEWYLEWKGKIIAHTPDCREFCPHTHRLGFAKEMLKEKLCKETIGGKDA